MKKTALFIALATAQILATVPATSAYAVTSAPITASAVKIVNAAVAFPTASTSSYIEMVAQNNISMFTSSSLSTRGTASPYKAYGSAAAYKGDVLKIYKLGTTFSQVAYPTSSGYKTAYCYTKDLLGCTAPTSSFTATGSATTYKYAGSTSYGSIAKGDTVIKLRSQDGYTFCIYAAKSGSRSWKAGWVLTSTFNKITCSNTGHNPLGYSDYIGSTPGVITCEGWSFDEDSYGSYVNILLYIDGQKVATYKANTYRPDVHSYYSNVPGINHGYSFSYSTNLTGNHNVKVYAQNVGGGSNTLLADKTVYISPVGKTNLSYGLCKTTSAKITCGFDGYVNTSGRHEGIDISAGNGSSVYSLTDGVITRVTYGSCGSSGLSTIAIYDAAHDKTVIYLHTAPISGLTVGQTIKKGQKIATQSWRGVSSSSGGHTHVEVRNGKRTAASKSVNDPVLDNANPTAYWNSLGYAIK